MKVDAISFSETDFLCVGCFGWGRAKSAREAYRIARANASPSYLKPEGRQFRVWRLCDQLDQVQVDHNGGWFANPKAGLELDAEQAKAAKILVWVGNEKAKLAKIPELPNEAIEG